MIRKSVCQLWHADIPPTLCRKARQSAVSYTTPMDTIFLELRQNSSFSFSCAPPGIAADRSHDLCPTDPASSEEAGRRASRGDECPQNYFNILHIYAGPLSKQNIRLFEHMKGGILEKHNGLAVANTPISDHVQSLVDGRLQTFDILTFIRVSAAAGYLVQCGI
jgi:hypothetical protein